MRNGNRRKEFHISYLEAIPKWFALCVRQYNPPRNTSRYTWSSEAIHSRRADNLFKYRVFIPIALQNAYKPGSILLQYLVLPRTPTSVKPGVSEN